MNKASVDSWARAQQGQLNIDGKIVKLPNLRLVGELGRGANAVVFEALDTTLHRPVAVKVWNSRGRQRAQAETAKIAKLQHPLVVTTHFLSWVEEHPYAVMELVVGQSGKGWLASNPSIGERTRVWKLYSRALKYVHDQGVVHGDPHTGNILVFSDETGRFRETDSEPDAHVGIKVADAGTSEFLLSRAKLKARESELIFETAQRLFHDQDLIRLWDHPLRLSHQNTLTVLNSLADFINLSVDFEMDRISENAEKLVRLVLKTPLFSLDGVLTHVNGGHQTAVARFARRLNRDLLDLHDWYGADELVGAEAREKYAAARAAYLKALADPAGAKYQPPKLRTRGYYSSFDD